MNSTQPKSQIQKPARSVIEWLLDSDPSIRYQVMRDLTDEPDQVVAAERARIATQGWGAMLLERQNADGTWGEDEGESFRRWNSTLHTMLLLQDMGIDPASERVRKAVDLLNENYTWGPHWGDTTFFQGEVEPCINGGVLELGGYFGHPNEPLLQRLLGEQLEDGGWNCEAENGSVRSSFHTTICVLEGLLEYEKAKGADAGLTAARRKGEEYLLERRLFRTRSTGQVIDERTSSAEKPVRATQFSFPNTWHYDVLRGLDYFRHSGAAPDKRLAEAIDLVVKKQGGDGRWLLENPHRDPSMSNMEEPGKPSRWNTLRALRVLDWYSIQT